MRGLSNGLAVFDLDDGPDVNRREILRLLIESDWFKGIEPDREFFVTLPTPDELSDSIGKNMLRGTNGDDEMHGGDDDDEVTALAGSDYLNGYDGNDILRAGRGRDIIIGGGGEDVMYGGFGHNTFKDSLDGEVDRLFFKSDQFALNYIYDKAENHSDGQKVDIIEGLDSFDRIRIQGIETSQITVNEVFNIATPSGSRSGIGIFADNYIEAVYTGNNLTVTQVSEMTKGVPV